MEGRRHLDRRAGWALALTAALLLPPAESGAGRPERAPRPLAAAPPTRTAPFLLDVDPPTATLAPGSEATFEVEIDFLGTFAADATRLRADGLPPGLRAEFVPDPMPHQGVSILTVSGTAPDGRYPFVVRAAADGVARAARGTLVVSRRPGFAMSVAPGVQRLAPGRSALLRVTVAGRNGFDRPVEVSAVGLPHGLTATPSRRVLSGGGVTLVRVAAAPSAPGGTHDVTITADDGLRAERASVPVVVQGTREWGTAAVGSTGSANNSIYLGNGRNDGVRRLYVGTIQTGQVVEFSWRRSSSSWGAGVPICDPACDSEIHNLTIGRGRDDGVSRIYACSIRGTLYEISRAGSGWSRRTVGTSDGACTDAFVGKGRNDGVNRVYATRGNAVYEYTRSGGGWTAVLVGRVPSGSTHGLAAGRARGSRRRLYVATDQLGTWEASFSNGRWSMVRLGDSGDVRNVSVGRGRDDRTNRVYAATEGGVVRELTWTGRDGGWRRRAINDPVGATMVHAYVVAGRNDGVRRVYASADRGNAYEFTWTSGGWRRRVLDGGDGYLYGFHFGRRPGSRRVRLYAASFDTNVYEYSWG